MKRLKRAAAAFLALMLVISSLANATVTAATPGTTTTIDATYRCYKGSNTGTSGTAPIGDSHYYWHYNADGSALNCPIRFMKESGTGRPIYCVEIGATFGGGYSYSTRELEDSPYWMKLSETARTGITYTTMYGYPVNNYGAANCDAYAATQVIIWEFAKGYRNLSGRTNAPDALGCRHVGLHRTQTALQRIYRYDNFPINTIIHQPSIFFFVQR